MQKTAWLNKKVNLASCREMKTLLSNSGLNTVCQESLCPNISECFSKKIATFMILGNVCTRSCKFCNLDKTKNPCSVDKNEPLKIKVAVKSLGLEYVVITSPTRDDLGDKGARAFFNTIKELKSLKTVKGVEVLIPDFLLDQDAIKCVVLGGPGVIAHNIETVPRLYQEVRSGSDYNRSLSVLKIIKEINPDILTKSGLMLGLGEEDNEVLEVLGDLRSVDCDFLSIGQYLAPSIKHYPVKEYISLKKFENLKQKALRLGFKHVESAPYVRSSYMADTYLSINF